MYLTTLVNFMYFEDRSRSTKCIANTQDLVTWRNYEKQFNEKMQHDLHLKSTRKEFKISLEKEVYSIG